MKYCWSRGYWRFDCFFCSWFPILVDAGGDLGEPRVVEGEFEMVRSLMNLFFLIVVGGVIQACSFGGNVGSLVVSQRQPTGELPNGTYGESCQECKLNHNILKCSCLDRKGVLRRSGINFSRCDGSIANDDGRLICEGDIFPAGTYGQTCKNCRFNGDVFVCRCADRKGRFVRARIKYQNCGSGSLRNQDGLLICDD